MSVYINSGSVNTILTEIIQFFLVPKKFQHAASFGKMKAYIFRFWIVILTDYLKRGKLLMDNTMHLK